MANGHGVHQRHAELQVESLGLAPKIKENAKQGFHVKGVSST